MKNIILFLAITISSYSVAQSDFTEFFDEYKTSVSEIGFSRSGVRTKLGSGYLLRYTPYNFGDKAVVEVVSECEKFLKFMDLDFNNPEVDFSTMYIDSDPAMSNVSFIEIAQGGVVRKMWTFTYENKVFKVFLILDLGNGLHFSIEERPTV